MDVKEILKNIEKKNAGIEMRNEQRCHILHNDGMIVEELKIRIRATLNLLVIPGK